MPRCLVTKKNVPGEEAIPVHIGDNLIGYVSEAVYADEWDEPDRKRVKFGD